MACSFTFDLGAEEHRAIVVARRPFQRASATLLRDATVEHGPAVGDDFHRLREIERVGRQQQRELARPARGRRDRCCRRGRDRRGPMDVACANIGVDVAASARGRRHPSVRPARPARDTTIIIVVPASYGWRADRRRRRQPESARALIFDDDVAWHQAKAVGVAAGERRT